jgi:hypothetical protein
MKLDTWAFIRVEVERFMVEETALQESMIRIIIDKVDGSFLCAAFVLHELSLASSFAQIEQIITKLPAGL